MSPIIGIDFDNTIACYDTVFHTAAVDLGLIPASLSPSKSAVRDYLRSIGKEAAWTELQGTIYGARMDLAKPYAGVDSFFSFCKAKEISAYIISHKTLHPFLGPRYDLHQAAKTWIHKQCFSWTPPAFFELTLQEKLERISKQECTIFIDDLPELLAETTFPSNVLKILFDPNNLYPEGDYARATSWAKILTLIEHAS